MQVHLFDGYWEDIGTIKSFYEANLELTRPGRRSTWRRPRRRSIRTPASCPDANRQATIRDSLVADGSMIEPGAVIENSVIGLRCRIGRNVVIRNTVLMGADYYEAPTTSPPTA